MTIWKNIKFLPLLQILPVEKVLCICIAHIKSTFDDSVSRREIDEFQREIIRFSYIRSRW